MGGGGFRVPLVYRALIADDHDRRVTDVALHDTDPTRLRAVCRVLEGLAAGQPGAPRVSAGTDLTEALRAALQEDTVAALRNDVDGPGADGLSRVEASALRVQLARRFHNDAVRAALGGGQGKDRPEPGTVDPAHLTAADPDWAG